MTSGIAKIDDAKFLELSEFTEWGVKRLDLVPTEPESSFNEACSIVLNQVYVRMTHAGIDFKDGSTIEPFFESFRLYDVGRASKFEKDMRELLNKCKIEHYLSVKDVLYQKCMSGLPVSDDSGQKTMSQEDTARLVVAVKTITKERAERNPVRESGNFFASKGFWIAVGAFVLIWLAYNIGKRDNHVLTPGEIQNAINECHRLGGEVLYDNNGEYQDCAINGRIQ